VVLGDCSDAWIWMLGGDYEFTMAYARIYIDSVMLDVGNVASGWNKMVPSKVNVFAWRLELNGCLLKLT